MIRRAKVTTLREHEESMGPAGSTPLVVGEKTD
jgi:hypothetical protein